MRTWLAGLLIFASCAGFAGLAIRIQRPAPSTPAAAPRPFQWIFGPSAEALEQRAGEEIRAGLETLNDPHAAPQDRLVEYRKRLAAADSLLVASLRARPAHAAALAQLAAVRWEISRGSDLPGYESEMIELASRMAPAVPRVQQQLGELLLRMGRDADAVDYFRRAVELDPAGAREVVTALRRDLFSAEQIYRALPEAPDVLAAMEMAFVEDSEQTRFIEITESLLRRRPDEISHRLLASFGRVSTRSGETERMLGALEELGPLKRSRVEAERLRQRSLGLRLSGHCEEAERDARAATLLQPELGGFLEHLADTLAGCRKPDEAIPAYREALGIAASRTAQTKTRARLYRKIGQAEESRGMPGRAYDAYKLAVELNPAERDAAGRLSEMEGAAGLTPAGER